MKPFALLMILIGLLSSAAGRTAAFVNVGSAERDGAGLIAHWKLDEGSGTAIKDSSGNDYDGTAVNTSWSPDVPDAPGVGAQSLYFDGSAYVDTADFDINDDFTFAAWIKPSESSAQALLGKHTAAGGNKVVFGLYGGLQHARLYGVADEAGHYLPNAWQHLIITGEKTGGRTLITIYRNGIVQNHFLLGDLVDDVSGGKPWTIGQEWDPGGRSDFYTGNMADVRLYDHTLDAAEIASLTEGFANVCTVPGDFPDVGEAMVSKTCDIVDIAAGNYSVEETLATHGLIVRGAGREETILNIARGQVRFGNVFASHGFADLTIRGGGQHDQILENGGAFWVDEKARLTLDNVAMRDNRSSSNGGSIFNNGGIVNIRQSLFENNGAGSWQGSGGAIFNSGTLDVRDSVFRRNILYAPGNPGWAVGAGGAIYNNEFGTAEIRRSTFELNDSGGGGALSSKGTMVVKKSVIEDSRSFVDGGAIYNRGMMVVEDTTISDNHAFKSGGAIYNNKKGDLTIRRSTISGNSVPYGQRRASAIHNWGHITLDNSTISGNFYSEVNSLNPDIATLYQQYYTASLKLLHTTLAGNAQADIDEGGRGLWIWEGEVEARNTILDDNGAVNCLVETAWKGQSGNLAGDGSCTGFTQSAELALSPLTDNGGLTKTMAIGSASAAVDTADAAYCTDTDQRGVGRDPDKCDVGAFEYTGGTVHLPLIIGR